jgi:hypothetical protein
MLIELGDVGTPFETYRIARPRAVRTTTVGPGAEAGVETESEDGTATLVLMLTFHRLEDGGRAGRFRWDLRNSDDLRDTLLTWCAIHCKSCMPSSLRIAFRSEVLTVQ